MKKAEYGCIINISSESGVQPDAFMPHYDASKAALINFTKSFSKAYAVNRILVNTVSPAFIMTTMLDNMLKTTAEKHGITFDEATQAFLKENRPHIELKRPGKVEEVASTVVYLASPPSLTGSTFVWMEFLLRVNNNLYGPLIENIFEI
ncbi:SDR family oxidoreductase [Peribacillus cavernae]|uniref:SDR family oxidoreductase n=2 Tax=Peribacillus cavernae TaxID=1674310 RepID=A0A3S0VE35_9BACI|nr:SDR family oxidoreductase [Peribacillus cavernae]